MSYSRVYRVWKAEGLGLPRRRPRKKIRGGGHRWMQAITPNAVWAFDFVHDECANGQKLKCLLVVDEWTHEVLAVEVGARIRSNDVVATLARLVSLYGPPAFVRSDNGPEFVAKAVRSWLTTQRIEASFNSQDFVGPFVHHGCPGRAIVHPRDREPLIRSPRIGRDIHALCPNFFPVFCPRRALCDSHL
ncbi:MAG: DDE-type integrase/transposase/recombinase [Myxococcota bacterium]